MQHSESRKKYYLYFRKSRTDRVHRTHPEKHNKCDPQSHLKLSVVSFEEADKLFPNTSTVKKMHFKENFACKFALNSSSVIYICSGCRFERIGSVANIKFQFGNKGLLPVAFEDLG